MIVNVGQCLERARELASVAESWRFDVELLLTEILECPRALLLAHPERQLSAVQAQRFERDLERRRNGEPVAYILGHREFWTIDLKVDPRVLIPRPETELLVETALSRLGGYQQQVTIADLGTGSGAVALSLARELRRATVWATDISKDALAVASDNAARMNLRNVRFRQGSWCEVFSSERFDLILSNPPYVAAGDAHLQNGDLRFEPPLALASGTDGLDAIRQIVSQAPRLLKPQGWLLLEHGYQQGEAVTALLTAQGLDQVKCWKDLAGLDRVSGGRLP